MILIHKDILGTKLISIYFSGSERLISGLREKISWLHPEKCGTAAESVEQYYISAVPSFLPFLTNSWVSPKDCPLIVFYLPFLTKVSLKETYLNFILSLFSILASPFSNSIISRSMFAGGAFVFPFYHCYCQSILGKQFPCVF